MRVPRRRFFDVIRVRVCVDARRFVPYVGHVTILLNENPMVKFGLLGIMALFALTGKD